MENGNFARKYKKVFRWSYCFWYLLLFVPARSLWVLQLLHPLQSYFLHFIDKEKFSTLLCQYIFHSIENKLSKMLTKTKFHSIYFCLFKCSSHIQNILFAKCLRQIGLSTQWLLDNWVESFFYAFNLWCFSFVSHWNLECTSLKLIQSPFNTYSSWIRIFFFAEWKHCNLSFTLNTNMGMVLC